MLKDAIAEIERAKGKAKPSNQKSSATPLEALYEIGLTCRAEAVSAVADYLVSVGKEPLAESLMSGLADQRNLRDQPKHVGKHNFSRDEILAVFDMIMGHRGCFRASAIRLRRLDIEKDDLNYAFAWTMSNEGCDYWRHKNLDYDFSSDDQSALGRYADIAEAIADARNEPHIHHRELVRDGCSSFELSKEGEAIRALPTPSIDDVLVSLAKIGGK